MSITIQSLLTTWSNAFKSGDPTEISKLLDDNFKHINLHQPEKGFDTLQESLDWIKTKPGIVSDIVSIYEDDKRLIGTFKWKDSDKNPDTIMFHGIISNNKLLRFEIVRAPDL